MFYEERTKSYVYRRQRRKSCVVLTYLWIQYEKKKYKRKERSIRSIDPLKLIKQKGPNVRGRAKRENKFLPLRFR